MLLLFQFVYKASVQRGWSQALPAARGLLPAARCPPMHPGGRYARRLKTRSVPATNAFCEANTFLKTFVKSGS
jgi:hypothetical protein